MTIVQRPRSPLFQTNVGTSLQLIINSEPQLRSGTTKPIRHNLRIFLPEGLLGKLAGKPATEAYFSVEIIQGPGLFLRVTVAEEPDNALHGEKGVHKLIVSGDIPYLQKGLADAAYGPWIEAYKQRWGRYDPMLDGWWVRGLESSLSPGVAFDFINIKERSIV